MHVFVPTFVSMTRIGCFVDIYSLIINKKTLRVLFSSLFVGLIEGSGLSECWLDQMPFRGIYNPIPIL